MTDFITMAHGNGGATMQELIRDYFVEAFDNQYFHKAKIRLAFALQRVECFRWDSVIFYR